jgi:hypothetical protein
MYIHRHYNVPLYNLLPKGLAGHAFWLVLHPLWGMIFFVVVNHCVSNEARLKQRASRAAAALAKVGLVSYSVYLMHLAVLQHLPQKFDKRQDQLAETGFHIFRIRIDSRWQRRRNLGQLGGKQLGSIRIDRPLVTHAANEYGIHGPLTRNLISG